MVIVIAVVPSAPRGGRFAPALPVLLLLLDIARQIPRCRMEKDGGRSGSLQVRIEAISERHTIAAVVGSFPSPWWRSCAAEIPSEVQLPHGMQWMEEFCRAPVELQLRRMDTSESKESEDSRFLFSPFLFFSHLLNAHFPSCRSSSHESAMATWRSERTEEPR